MADDDVPEVRATYRPDYWTADWVHKYIGRTVRLVGLADDSEGTTKVRVKTVDDDVDITTRIQALDVRAEFREAFNVWLVTMKVGGRL